MLASLRAIHAGWAWVVIGGNALAGLWALAAHRWPALRTRALWWVTGFVQVAVFVEVGLGVALDGRRHVNAPRLHAFYGFLAIVAVGVVHSYRHQLRHRLYLLYGAGGLFITGLAVRALLIRPP